MRTIRYARHICTALLFGVSVAAISTTINGSARGSELVCNTTLYYCSNPEAYDIVTINTTATGSTSALAGFGVYLNSNAYELKTVSITTTGDKADAIRSNSQAVYFYADNLFIKTTGSSADGINLASNFDQNFDSLAYIARSATIEVTSGIGVRANNHRNVGANTVIILPDHSSIKVIGTGTASNSSEGDGYAVYAGNRDLDTNGLSVSDLLAGKNNNTLGNSYVFVGDSSTIETSTRNGHAVYANKGGLVQLGDGTSIRTTGQNAYAIYASTEQQGTHTDNVRPGYVYLKGGATLRAENSDIVMRALGAGSVISSEFMTVPEISDSHSRTDRLGLDKNMTQASSGIFDIVGKIDAISGGRISLNMSDGSYFLGSTNIHLEQSVPSVVNLDISGASSKWVINEDSTLTSLNLKSGATLTPYRSGLGATSYALTGSVNNVNGVIDLTDPAETVGDVLTINGNYASNGGTLRLNAYYNSGGALSNQQTDRLIINGDVSGTTMVKVISVAGSPGDITSVDGNYLATEGISLVQVSGNATASSFQLAGGYTSLNGMPYLYQLYAYGPTSANGAADTSQRLVSGSNPYWDYRLQSVYMVDPPSPNPDPDQNPDPASDPGPARSPAAQPARQIWPQAPAYIVAPTALFQAGLQDISNLHKRLGEIRNDRTMGNNGGTGEFFMRAYGGKYDYFSNRSISAYGYDANIDYAAVQMGGNLYAFENASGITRFGIAGTIGSLSFDPKGAFNPTGAGTASSARLDTWSVAAYATYLHNSGWYVDGIVSFGAFDGHVSTNLRGRTASLSGKSFSASIETGYPIALGNGLVLEPQAQLVYQRLMFDRKEDVDNFTVNLGNQDQLTGRLGARLSKTFNADTDKLVTLYAKANVLHGIISGGKVFLGDTFRLGRYGTAVEAGLGVSATLSKNLSLYADAAYQHKVGKSGVSGISLNGGLRYSF